MLPLLPALLILLLGPSNLERIAHDGRFPAVTEAIHRGFSAADARDANAIARLLSTSRNSDLSRTLLNLLVGLEGAREIRIAPLPSALVKVPAFPILAMPEGFVEGRRTRDGPR